MYCMKCFLKSKYIKSRTFNDKNRCIIKKVMVFKKLLQHLATRGTYSPGDWRCDEAWREQTLVYPPVMCQQRLIYCTWELNVMKFLKVSSHHWFSLCHISTNFAKCKLVLTRICLADNELNVSKWLFWSKDSFEYHFKGSYRWQAEACLNIKTGCMYRDFLYELKAVTRLFYLYTGNLYTAVMAASLYWDSHLSVRKSDTHC